MNMPRIMVLAPFAILAVCFLTALRWLRSPSNRLPKTGPLSPRYRLLSISLWLLALAVLCEAIAGFVTPGPQTLPAIGSLGACILLCEWQRRRLGKV